MGLSLHLSRMPVRPHGFRRVVSIEGTFLDSSRFYVQVKFPAQLCSLTEAL